VGRVGVDASIFLCVLLPGPTKAGESNIRGSEKLLRSVGRDSMAVTSSIVFAEVAWAFLREGKETVELEAAKQVIEGMGGLEIIPVDNEIAWLAGRFRRRYYSGKLQLSYQDALYLATCIQNGVKTFYTTDSHLLSIDEKSIQVLKPSA